MKKSFLLLTLLSIILVGCNQSIPSNKDASADSSSVEDKIEVVTSFYPLAFMTEQIVGNKANVINLAGAGDVHDYEPSPQDMVKLNTADLVVFQGSELEPWTDGVIEKLEALTLEVSQDLDLAKIEEHEDHEEDSHEDEGMHHDEEKGYDEHNHGEFDPHTWLDPVLAQQMIKEILETLIKVDTANIDTYKANATALGEKFIKLDESFRKQLSQCVNEEVIVSHDAFGYLARRYGFIVHPIAGLSTNDEPSAKVLAELKEEAEEGITHILIEENNIQHFADTLAGETGLKMLSVNPLGRGTLDINKDFIDVMYENLNSFKTSLNCK